VNKLTAIAALIPVLFGLSACVVVEPSSQGSGSASASQTVSRAESECLAAVANQVGKGDVSTISVRQGETSTVVLVRVPGAQAPWRCDWGPSGVIGVQYTSEG
jgi:starvation-inducible outer membrane lipoprotein